MVWDVSVLLVHFLIVFERFNMGELRQCVQQTFFDFSRGEAMAAVWLFRILQWWLVALMARRCRVAAQC